MILMLTAGVAAAVSPNTRRETMMEKETLPCPHCGGAVELGVYMGTTVAAIEAHLESCPDRECPLTLNDMLARLGSAFRLPE
jgi:hypothetical protein